MITSGQDYCSATEDGDCDTPHLKSRVSLYGRDSLGVARIAALDSDRNLEINFNPTVANQTMYVEGNVINLFGGHTFAGSTLPAFHRFASSSWRANPLRKIVTLPQDPSLRLRKGRAWGNDPLDPRVGSLLISQCRERHRKVAEESFIFLRIASMEPGLM